MDQQVEITQVSREYLKKGLLYCIPRFGKKHISLQHIDWNSILSEDTQYRWFFWGLGPLFHILQNKPTPPTMDQVILSIDITNSWFSFIKKDVNKYLSIDKHATACRTIVFLDLYSYVEENNFKLILEKILMQHAFHLLDDSNYDFGWNHGLDQDRALYGIGCVFANEGFKNHAIARMLKTIPHMVDDDGVSCEQSVHYQRYARYILLKIKELMKLHHDNRLDAVLGRIDKMADFLAHATYPNGTYIPLGDTPLSSAQCITGTLAEYAATLGRRGSKPADSIYVSSAGYIFGRSGWGETVPLPEESCYSIRFGRGRGFHGHNDHTSFTYYTHGEEVVCECGFSGYSDPSWRKVMQHPTCHNVVYSNTPKRFCWMNETKLISSKCNSHFHSFILEDVPYINVTRRRSIAFLFEKNIIIVLDKLITGNQLEFKQIFHFPNYAKCIRFLGNFITMKYENSYANIYQVWPFNNSKLLWGDEGAKHCYIADKNYTLMPSTAFETSKFSQRNQATFLTIFSFAPDDHVLHVSDAKMTGDVRRKVNISGYKDVSFLILPDGTLHINED